MEIAHPGQQPDVVLPRYMLTLRGQEAAATTRCPAASTVLGTPR